MRCRWVVLLVMGSVCCSLAYNANYGPFVPGSHVERVSLTPLSPHEVDEDGERDEYRYSVDALPDVQLDVIRTSESHSLRLIVSGQEFIPLTEFSDYYRMGAPEVYSADLNQDGRADFVVYSYSGGCGLACGYCNVAFVLSGDDGGYSLSVVSTLFPDETDFVMLKGRPCFVHTSFQGVNKCKDGKCHNFWIYNLFALDREQLPVENSIHPDFPKFVFYSNKPNSAETDLISEEQKRDLLTHSEIQERKQGLASFVLAFRPIDAQWKKMYDEIEGATLEEKSFHAMTTWEMKAVSWVACWQDEKRMLDTARTLFESLDDEGQKLFLEAHVAWKKYVEADAGFLTDSCRGGSMRGLCASGVEQTLIQRRTTLYQEMVEGQNIVKDDLTY